MRYNVWSVLSLVLFALGVIFYLFMGVMHSGWTDTGVYALTFVLVGFGAAGAYAASLEAENAN